MNRIIYKIYKDEPKEIIYMTFDMDEAVRKYFMHIKEHSHIEIWKGQCYVGIYNIERYDLKLIKSDLKSMLMTT